MSSPDDVTFSSLDPSQKNTFREIVNGTTNLHVVHGPPGTGKSQLVVSLLERLASDGKKILFVSQNTEALRVIERMIRRTEKTIGYPSDDKYISLLDFCLMLHEPTHRQLKYLREQYTRITSRELPQISNMSAPYDIQYVLKYTNLDHDTNFNINDTEIGFDELVGYYLRYVNHTIAPEPLRNFEQVDIRAIFHALDNYEHPEHFGEFNKPRRELILLSSENPNLSLPEVRASLKSITEGISGSWTKMFACKKTTDVVDYLQLLLAYQTAIKYLDIHRVATEDKNPMDIAKALREFLDANTTINEQKDRIEKYITTTKKGAEGDIAGITDKSRKIHLGVASVEAVEKNLTDVLNDRKKIQSLLNSVKKTYPDLEHIGIGGLQAGLAKAVSSIIGSKVSDFKVLRSLTSENIDDLNNALEEYFHKSSMKRMISGAPAVFKELLEFDSAKDLSLYRDGLAETLTGIKPLLDMAPGSTVGTILKLGSKDPQIPLSKLGIKTSKNLQSAVEMLSDVYKLALILAKYDIDTDSYEHTVSQFEEFSAGILQLEEFAANPKNKPLYLRETIDGFIDTINTNIDLYIHKKRLDDLNNLQRKLYDESYLEHGGYLANIKSADDYAQNANEIYDYLAHKESVLAKLIQGVSLPDDNMKIEANIEAIEDIINAANLTDNFSDFFFEMSDGQTLKDWLAGIKTLETYNNDAEMFDFVQHNNSINGIRTALGIDNYRYINNILDNEITFDEFAGRIINAVVNECFGRAPLRHKRQITTKDLIKAYDTYLNNQKAATYRNHLRDIYRQSSESAIGLSRQSTLQASGKSTMDKYRHNTAIIASAFPIICATPKEVSKYLAANKGLFDYVIFDEASQLLPGQALPSMYRAKKAVIIGDPHQMPPSLNASFSLIEQSEDEFDDLGESILDLAIKQPQKKHYLKVHYRSKYNKLFEPSLEAIYGKEGVKPIFEAQLGGGAPIDIIDDLGDGIDESGYDKNFYKICEAVEEYYATNSRSDFCILFSQAGMLAKFKEFLADIGARRYSKVAQLDNSEKILLSTVTNCQGIEGMFTIIYLHHYSSPGAMWFFKESAGAYKRLNVSITRQREGLKLLLADPRSHWIRACDSKINGNTGPNTRQSAELMKSLLMGAGEQADVAYLDRKLGQNTTWFDSPLTDRLYEKLTDHYTAQINNGSVKIYSEVGWHLVIPRGDNIEANERNVGFRIDLGIYSAKHKKFVLGIEMDGAMYHSGFDKEQSDYNRQKILEEKGWKLYRIWSTNWLSNTEGEFKKLVENIDRELNTDPAPEKVNDDNMEPAVGMPEQDGEIARHAGTNSDEIVRDAALEGSARESGQSQEKITRIALEDFRTLVVSQMETKLLLGEEVRIGENDPILRCELIIPKETIQKFTTALTFAITSSNARKIVDAGTYRIVIDSNSNQSLIIGALYGNEIEASIGNSFTLPRIATQRLKDTLAESRLQQSSLYKFGDN